MTREEEIKCASKDYVNYLLDKQEYHNEKYTEHDIKQAFEEGAEWADKTIIEKACEWISQSYTSGVLDWKNCDSIIEDFEKAMKE